VYVATDYVYDFSFESFKICGTGKRYSVIVAAYLEFNLVKALQLSSLLSSITE
jgi:hypothetical protein